MAAAVLGSVELQMGAPGIEAGSVQVGSAGGPEAGGAGVSKGGTALRGGVPFNGAGGGGTEHVVTSSGAIFGSAAAGGGDGLRAKSVAASSGSAAGTADGGGSEGSRAEHVVTSSVASSSGSAAGTADGSGSESPRAEHVVTSFWRPVGCPSAAPFWRPVGARCGKGRGDSAAGNVKSVVPEKLGRTVGGAVQGFTRAVEGVSARRAFEALPMVTGPKAVEAALEAEIVEELASACAVGNQASLPRPGAATPTASGAYEAAAKARSEELAAEIEEYIGLGSVCISVLGGRFAAAYNARVRTGSGKNDGSFKAWLKACGFRLEPPLASNRRHFCSVRGRCGP